MASSKSAQIIIVYAPAQNAFYTDVARRLFLACLEVDPKARLVKSDSVHELPLQEIRGASAILVNPVDLVQDVLSKALFYETMSKFRNRIMILAESIETHWFSNQLRLPMSINAFVDIGFISQESKMKAYGFSHIPYKFLFNGLLRREREKVASIDTIESARRSIPWTFIGHKTIERVEFARWLAEKVDAKGVTFLPDRGKGVRPGSGAISPQGLSLLLKKSKYYVWISHHEFAYYESFRFREAVLNGAVPLKLDSKFAPDHSSIPGIASSSKELASFLVGDRYEQAYEASRAYYFDRNVLEDDFRTVVLDAL